LGEGFGAATLELRSLPVSGLRQRGEFELNIAERLGNL
jgi:hypothetical protein